MNYSINKVESKFLGKNEFDPIIHHYYNNRNEFLKREPEDKTIEKLIQHIIFLQEELNYANNIIEENPQIFCTSDCAFRGCDHLD